MNIAIFNCFRSRTGDNFIPYSTHVDHHEASPEDDASNVLSGSGRLLEWRPTTDAETFSKDPKWVFEFLKDKVSGVNGDECVHSTKFSPC